jgi:AmiR/NasT family two-component response regulator
MAVRVLVTDGSSETRDILRCHLECIGCVVVAEAGSAAQALPLLTTIRPEVVALGADAAPSNTLDLVRLIKREAPQTSVLLIGREISEQDVQVFRQAGVLGCFSAPLEFANLWRTLSMAYPELMTGAFADMISAAAARATRA